tara:strand:+ start:196 stop:570 length:375 start_codon:yes stop_codon:yes gene_type:complete
MTAPKENTCGSNKNKLSRHTEGKKCSKFHWALPCIAHAYLPLMVLLSWVSSKSGSDIDTYEIFVFSGSSALVLVPLYLSIVGILTVMRIKNGTNSVAITVLQLSPILIWIYMLITVITFGGSPV